jgi:hypothetical protein
MPEEAARPTAGRRAATKDSREIDFFARRRLSLVEQEWETRNLGRGTSSDRQADAARRTVVIRGQVADRYGTRTPSARSGSRGRSSSYGPLSMQPDRAALWAVLLGIALVIVALASAHM